MLFPFNQQTVAMKIFRQQRTTITGHHCIKDFFLRLPRSSLKGFFLGSDLGEALWRMSAIKWIPKEFKMVECEWGMGWKNSPICYIPILEQDTIQDALEKSKKTTYFKLTLPYMGNKLKVAIWPSRTPEQFLLHVRTAMHVCKQIGLTQTMPMTPWH